jgi:hypothetical protein
MRGRHKGGKNKTHKIICVNGHDILLVGRYSNGNCKQCARDRNKTPEVTEYNKKYKQTEKYKEQRKIYNRTEKRKQANKKHNKIYREQHKEELAKKNKEWRIKNKDLVREKDTAKVRKKLDTDPLFKLAFNLRSRIRIAVRKNYKSGSAVKDLGCSVTFLKQYLESKFYGNMTWDNWGKVWELDHIKPLFLFDLTDQEQFKQAVRYTNLQPLTIPDHKKKTAKELKDKLRGEKK